LMPREKRIVPGIMFSLRVRAHQVIWSGFDEPSQHLEPATGAKSCEIFS